MGNQPLSQQTLGCLAHLVFAGAKLDAPGLAPGAGMDLRLDRPAGATDFGGAIYGLLGTLGDTTARNRNPEAGEQLFGLIFVDIQGALLLTTEG